MPDDLTALQCVKIVRAKGFKHYITAEVKLHRRGKPEYDIYLEHVKPSPFFTGESFKACMKLVDKHFKENLND